jgi:hypothetical protein
VPENKGEAVRGVAVSKCWGGEQLLYLEGRGLNLHYWAGDAYKHIFEFIASNGL